MIDHFRSDRPRSGAAARRVRITPIDTGCGKSIRCLPLRRSSMRHRVSRIPRSIPMAASCSPADHLQRDPQADADVFDAGSQEYLPELRRAAYSLLPAQVTTEKCRELPAERPHSTISFRGR
jgi:hypothetical protein